LPQWFLRYANSILRFDDEILVSKQASTVSSELVNELLRFQVLTAASMKMTVFWDVAPCSLVEISGPDDGAASTSKTSVNFYQTTQRNNPEDSHLLAKKFLDFYGK
jgi:hypothetical protein